MDGDSTNNDQGVGEYKKGHGGYWNGGDLKGIIEKLDYIKELGATGIWITPPVANQWRNPQKTGTGNHGYWASNFMEIDKHLGNIEDYQRLSASLHKNKMYLIQDVVCNHLGDFYTYTGPYNPEDVTENFSLHEGHAPTQYPFTHNNALDSQDRALGIYHFTPNFNDHSDTVKKRLYQFADLDDLNTSNPLVRKTLRKSFNYWIEQVGVDGFRFDTPHFVEHDFWHDFIHSGDIENPGVEKFARSMGKDKFFTFGEVAIPARPLQQKEVLQSSRYLGTPDKPEMTSILNFPLFFAIQRVFQEKRPTALMTYRLNSLKTYFPNPELLVNFIDNHDGARFLSRADRASFRQALLFMMTLPGVPVIYYGTEQELLGMRQTMFKGGAGSQDKDHFDPYSESFQFMQELIELRKNNPVFRRGQWEVLQDAPGGPGVFAYKMEYGKEQAFILFNTAEREMLASKIPLGLPAGTELKIHYTLQGGAKSLFVDRSGNISLMLPPQSARVYLPKSNANGQPKGESLAQLRINPLAETVITQEHMMLEGTSLHIDTVWVSIDGNTAKVFPAVVKPDGSWQAELSTKHCLNGTHRVTVFGNETDNPERLLADAANFELKLPVKPGKLYIDPIGDDHGREGNIAYPTAPSFSHQQDIEAARIDQIGTNLSIKVTMREISQVWLPPNEFDHALINIFINLPDKKGQRLLPFQNTSFPEGGDWDYRFSVAGFGSAIYSHEGSGATQAGTISGPTPLVRANLEQRTLTFTLSAEALGYPERLSGTQIYINTWDGGPGNLRPISSIPHKWQYSGGTNEEVKIMDEMELIVLE